MATRGGQVATTAALKYRLLIIALVLVAATVSVDGYLKRYKELSVEPYKWQELRNAATTKTDPSQKKVEGDQAAAAEDSKPKMDLPTTFYTEDEFPLFRHKIRNFGCDACQSVVWVGKQLVEEKLNPDKPRTRSEFGKLDVIIEDLMDGLTVCKDVDKWAYVANHSEVFIAQDLQSFCGLLLEGDEEVFVDELEKRRIVEEATKQVCHKQYKVCTLDELWKEGDKLEDRRETIVRNRAYGEQFQQKFREELKAKVTDSGLHYVMYKQGMPHSDEELEWKARIQYNSTLVNGISFDDSGKWGDYVDVGFKEVVTGMQEAIKLAGVGGEILISVPPELGYGANGAGRFVGPDATILFRLNVLEAVEPSCPGDTPNKKGDKTAGKTEEKEHKTAGKTEEKEGNTAGKTEEKEGNTAGKTEEKETSVPSKDGASRTEEL